MEETQNNEEPPRRYGFNGIRDGKKIGSCGMLRRQNVARSLS